MKEAAPTSSYGIQGTISHCVGGPIPPQDFDPRSSKLPQNKIARSAPVLSGLVLHGDRGRQRPCASAHGDSAPVQREQGGEHTEKQHQSRTSCKVWFSRQGVLGWRRNLGQGVLCVHGRCQ